MSLLYKVVYVIKCNRPHSLSEMSQRVSFHISLIVFLSESFCWSVYLSVCTCVLPASLCRVAVELSSGHCRDKLPYTGMLVVVALVQTNGHSMPWTKLTNGWKLPSANRGVSPRTVVGAFAHTGTERGNAISWTCNSRGS